MINNLSTSRKCPPPCCNNTLKKKEKQRGTSFLLGGSASGETPLPPAKPSPCCLSSPLPAPKLFLTGQRCDRKLAGYFLMNTSVKEMQIGFFFGSATCTS